MAPALAENLALAVAVALTMLGAVTAWSAGNAVKRFVAALTALTGALAALAALGVTDALLAGLGVSIAVLIIGAALIVRVQEVYGGLELGEIDVADTLDDSQPELGKPEA